jgi:3-deoxy-D-arabino-heptulosonate 7-phosphate (DAHP) synthase
MAVTDMAGNCNRVSATSPVTVAAFAIGACEHNIEVTNADKRYFDDIFVVSIAKISVTKLLKTSKMSKLCRLPTCRFRRFATEW